MARHPQLSAYATLASHALWTSRMESDGYRTLHWTILHHFQVRCNINVSIGDTALTAFPNFTR
eukprot:443478-Rhodomonas_salina.1